MKAILNACDEIRNHEVVEGVEFISNNEIEINFVDDSYGDLIIPVESNMTNDQVLSVFYYYVQNYKEPEKSGGFVQYLEEKLIYCWL